MGDTRAWLEGELRRMLGFDEVEEIAGFALLNFSVAQPAELRQYLEQFLGQSEKVRKLCDELVARRSGAALSLAPKPGSTGSTRTNAGDDFWGAGGGSCAAKSTAKSPARGGQWQEHQPRPAVKGKVKGKVYKKPAAEEEEFWGGGKGGGTISGGRPASLKSAASRPGPSLAAAPALKPTCHPGPSSRSSLKGSAEDGGEKLRTKTKAREVVAKTSAGPRGRGGKVTSRAQAPGPTKTVPAATGASKGAEQGPAWSGITCLCMGKKHDAITNCTACGKIACAEEGGFGCSFCGSALPVTGREPRRSSGPLGAEVEGAAQSTALKEALARKDRLLLFDRTSASRTRVLDDQGDYFTSHNWLSREEREKGEAEEKARRDDAEERRGARRQVKLSIDIMGRRVIEAKETGDGEAERRGRVEGIEGERPGAAEQEMDGVGVVGFGTGSATGTGAPHNGTPGSARDPGNQRPSLENTGLQGRAKEVYDVMRSNLEKQGRRGPGGSSAKRGGFRVAEKSRVSLWRVQHDLDSDDVVRPNQMVGSGGGIGGRYEKFDPVDELACK